jgi:SAM-dependent methyltransferase
VTARIDTDVGVLERLVSPAGKDVVDIGCGGGALVRELTGLGARVVGVEISESQLATARARDPDGSARYLVGRAQDLPLGDREMDAAVFMRTLHHVPAPEQLAALGEAARVLRPGGVVYAAEPLAEGDYFELVSLVEDELEVRRAAQEALAHADRAGLSRRETVDYGVRIEIADLAALRSRVVSVDPARAEVFDSRRSELERAFGRLGEPGPHGERTYVQPMRADLLRAD